MKVRISYTVEVDDHVRRAINEWYGRPGLASRAQIQDWYEAHGRSMDADLSQTDERIEGHLPREGYDDEYEQS